jgi:hypothetical protein
MLKKAKSIRSVASIRKRFAKILPDMPIKRDGKPNESKAFRIIARQLACSPVTIRNKVKGYGIYSGK